MSYNSKYTGQEVENLLDQVAQGGGSSSGGSGAYAEVNHGTNDTTFTLTPNTFHIWDEVSALTLNLGSETNGVANEFLFQFLSGSTPTTLSLPDDLKWPDDEPLTPEADKMYQLSILKGAVSVLSWSTAAKSVFPAILKYGTTTELGKAVYAELEKIGTSGILEEGLLYVIVSSGAQVSVTTFNYDSSRGAYRLTFGMVSNFLNADGYCFEVIID